MIEDHFGMYLLLVPHCMTEILAKECKSGKSAVLVFSTVGFWIHAMVLEAHPTNCLRFSIAALIRPPAFSK